MDPVQRLQHHIANIKRRRVNFMNKYRKKQSLDESLDEIRRRRANYRARRQYQNAARAFARRTINLNSYRD